MATTTNFGWETPDDTDLVKDGAAAMRTLGNSIDTSFVDLKGGTTGQILAKASNTDLDYTWITNDVGDITAVNAGAGLTGGGTSGSVTLSLDSAAVIAPTIVDAKGDIIAATAADTVSRLAVGSNDQVLMADSSTATGLKWATPSSGSMTLLSTTSLSSATTTVTTINGTYKHLYINVKARPASGSNTWMAFQLNGYGQPNIQHWGSNAAPNTVTAYGDSATNTRIIGNQNHSPDYGDANLDLFIYNYANNIQSTSSKSMTFQSRGISSAGNNIWAHGAAQYVSNSSAISSFSFITNSASFQSGTIAIYGVN